MFQNRMICPVKEHVYWCWWHFCPNCTIWGEVVSTPLGRMGTQEGGLPPMHGPCLRHLGRYKNTLFNVPRYSIRSNRSISSMLPQLSALGPSRADDGTRTSGACADMGGAHAVVLACVWKRPLAFLRHCPSPTVAGRLEPRLVAPRTRRSGQWGPMRPQRWY